MDQFIDWIYGQVFGFLGGFFSPIGGKLPPSRCLPPLVFYFKL
ncbi:MAG: hypothetical protein ACOX0U_02745 [Oscillospiraceae bacterium]